MLSNLRHGPTGAPRIYNLEVGKGNHKGVVYSRDNNNSLASWDKLNDFWYTTPSAFQREWEEGQYLDYKPPEVSFIWFFLPCLSNLI
jgi:hypothetical protein